MAKTKNFKTNILELVTSMYVVFIHFLNLTLQFSHKLTLSLIVSLIRQPYFMSFK